MNNMLSRFVRTVPQWTALSLSALAFSGQVNAQSLAQEFNQILNNGQTGIAARCRAAFPQSASCDDYNITPTTDLQMRFAAPEELAAQKSLVKEFSSQQLKAVAGRLGALRMQTAQLRNGHANADTQLADGSVSILGGGAAADDVGSPFSIYGTLSHGFGSRDQTAYEDEADYTGNDLVIGADYRVGSGFVIGGSLGYSDKELELSANYSDSTTPITPNAAADSESSGLAVNIYGQWEGDLLYVSASLGGQWLTNDLRRRADYVTSASPVALTATASTDTMVIQGSLSAGLVWSIGATTIDTALNAHYQNATTDEFQESGAACTSGACIGTNLNMRFAEQEVKSLEASLSVRVQHAITAGSMVLIPFVSGELIKQQEDDRYAISGMYVPLYGIIPNFNLNTDNPDTDYYAVAAGLSFVAQGSWQGFLRYRTTLDLDNVSDSVIAAGVRFEF